MWEVKRQDVTWSVRHKLKKALDARVENDLLVLLGRHGDGRSNVHVGAFHAVL